MHKKIKLDDIKFVYFFPLCHIRESIDLLQVFLLGCFSFDLSSSIHSELIFFFTSCGVISCFFSFISQLRVILIVKNRKKRFIQCGHIEKRGKAFQLHPHQVHLWGSQYEDKV